MLSNKVGVTARHRMFRQQCTNTFENMRKFRCCQWVREICPSLNEMNGAKMRANGAPVS